MRIILHDLSKQEFDILYKYRNSDTTIISDNGTIQKCIGCFGCWIKTPGVCVLKDGYQNMGELLSRCQELIIISECLYGSYSPFVLNVLNRSIPYVLPYFVSKNGETHHQNRYENKFSLSVYFYGEDLTDIEKNTARALVEANGVNMYSKENNIYFYNDLKGIKEALK